MTGISLLGADKKPVVHITTKKDIKGIYYAYRPEDALTSEDEEPRKDSELLQIYVKQGLTAKTGYLDTEMRADFTDITTGERCKIEMQGEWRSRSAVLWLKRGHDSSRNPIGKIYRSLKAMRNSFNLNITPNVDTALVLLIVDEELKILRRYENRFSVVNKAVECCE